jgi:hypothetical protein
MDVAGEDGIERQDGAEGLSVRYLKCEAYFCKRDMVARRLNTSLPHVPCASPDKKPKSCVWCCRSKHSHPDPKHTRHGRTTKFMCLVCNVSLCRVKRYDGKSCHDLFHSSTTLVDYCRAAMDEDVVHVVPHSNRPGPPNRQRVTSPAIADNSGTNSEEFSEDDEQPRRRLRSRVTPVIAAPRRRHYAAHLHGPRGRYGQERR